MRFFTPPFPASVSLALAVWILSRVLNLAHLPLNGPSGQLACRTPAVIVSREHRDAPCADAYLC